MHVHRRAAILSVGDELTLGQALDTNSRWLSEQLVARGVMPIKHTTVPDDAQAITFELSRLAQSADVVIVTGGLGPTADDLVRQALADLVHEELLEDAQALEQIEAFFRTRGREMPEINRVQALVPRDAEVVPNPQGTAPGLHLVHREHDCDIFCLPGPPREMQPMFVNHVVPRLRPPGDRTVRTKLLHVHGLSESEVARRLGALMDRTRVPLVGTTASQAIITCRIRFEGSPQGAGGRSPESLVDETAEEVRRRLSPYVFGADGETLSASVLEVLKAQGRTLAVVESCTGGMLGGMLTDVAGSSAAFVGGWITYSNQAKQREVGVPPEMFALGGPGAVSAACAEAMALGGLHRAGADDCLAVTGIAGPEGGLSSKPVGTVFIAHAWRAAPEPLVDVRRFYFPGERALVREWSCRAALGMLRLRLIGQPEAALLGEQRPGRG